jgi:hypothetical protein
VKRKGTGRPADLPLMAGGPSGCKESEGKRGNGRGLEWAIYCLNWRPQLEGKRGGRRPGVARFAAASGRPGGGVRKKKRKGGEGETDRWGRGVSESKEKEKERESVGRRGERLAGCWAARAER